MSLVVRGARASWQLLRADRRRSLVRRSAPLTSMIQKVWLAIDTHLSQCTHRELSIDHIADTLVCSLSLSLSVCLPS